METSTSYIIAGVSLFGVCLIRICIQKIRSYFSRRPVPESANNVQNKENHPVYI